MQICIKPKKLAGSIKAVSSKSYAHRAIICAALSRGKCTVSPIALSNDIKATIQCVEALGAKTEINGSILTVDGTEMFKNKTAVLDCGESGSTLRFLIPVAAAGGAEATFVGSGRLPERPIGIYTELLPEKGVTCSADSGLPLTIGGKLKSGVFRVAGNVSSQFITGLLFALPLLDGDSDIILTSPIQSEVDMTDKGWHVRGKQHYIPTDYITDGDWSQAAFFLVAGAIGGEVTVNNANIDSSQGDRKIAALLREFGAEVSQYGGKITVKHAPMSAIEIDASQIPDLVPVLAVCASFAEGTTKITHAERLRVKESDRLKTTAELINALGGKVREMPDGLEITGAETLIGAAVEGCNDHRIVMSAATCAAGCQGEITCSDAWSVNKSYPDFYSDYAKINGRAILPEAEN